MSAKREDTKNRTSILSAEEESGRESDEWDTGREESGTDEEGAQPRERDAGDSSDSDVVVVEVVPASSTHHHQQQQQSPSHSPKHSPDAKPAGEEKENQSPSASPKSERSPSPHQQHANMEPPHAQSNPQQQQQQAWFSPSVFLPTVDSAASSADGGDSADPNARPSAAATAQRVLGELHQRLQPWATFLRPSKFGCPSRLAAIGPRVKRNLAQFLTNYLCLFVLLLIYCVITSFLMLLTLIVLAGLFYSVYQFTAKGPVVVGTYEVPPSLLYTVALMLCIPLFWLAGAGSVMYWVLGSGLFLMLAHSTFYASEEVPGAEFEVVVNA